MYFALIIDKALRNVKSYVPDQVDFFFLCFSEHGTGPVAQQ